MKAVQKNSATVDCICNVVVAKFHSMNESPMTVGDNNSCHTPSLEYAAGSNGLSQTIRESENTVRTAETWYASANWAGTPRSVAAFALPLILLSTGLLVSCNSATIEYRRRMAPSSTCSTRCVRWTSCRVSRSRSNAATTTSGQNRAAAARRCIEGTEVTAVSDERPQPTSSGNGFDLNFENTPGRHRRQGRARRHPWRRLHDRSARAGHRQPGLGAAGRQIRHHLRAGKCLAASAALCCSATPQAIA